MALAELGPGEIDRGARTSTPDRAPFRSSRAKERAPNLLLVVLDDPGAASDAAAGLVATPTLRRIAGLGPRYGNGRPGAHPSTLRAGLLARSDALILGPDHPSGRATGIASSGDIAAPENGTIAEILSEHGYNTYCVSACRVAPTTDVIGRAPRPDCPPSRGFERVYLAFDHHFSDSPPSRKDGHHLSQELVDKAIDYIGHSTQIAPDKPWLMYVAFGKSPIPCQVTDLDSGPRGGPPTTAPSDVHETTLGRLAASRNGHANQTERELGRLIDYLEESRQIRNTIVVVISDGGAGHEDHPLTPIRGISTRHTSGAPDAARRPGAPRGAPGRLLPSRKATLVTS
jgi:arylsulfatase